MKKVAVEPQPSDILSRNVAFCLDASSMALSIQPWVAKNKYFTQMCVLKLMGMKFPEDAVASQVVSKRLAEAFKHLKVQKTLDRTPMNDFIYRRPDEEVVVVPEVPVRVTESGFSVKGGEREPAADQIKVCREWIQKHCRKRKTVKANQTSHQMKHWVEKWTRSQPDMARRLQYNWHDKVAYRSEVYYVSQGAFIKAALEEGYQARQILDSQYAVFNMSVRKDEDSEWRGRKPLPATGRESFRTDMASKVKKSLEELGRNRLAKFLDKMKRTTAAGLGHRRGPLFTSKDAARETNLKFSGRRPTNLLLKLLREAGCIQLKMQVDMKPEMRGWRWHKEPMKFKAWWARYVDMPEDWKMGNSHMDPTVTGENSSEPEVTPHDASEEGVSEGYEEEQWLQEVGA